MKIFCIIPAFNEEKNIGKVVKKVKPFVDEIVVVDDASTDTTAFICDNIGITILKHPINRGQGAALQTGNEYALECGADIIVHFDADDQFAANEINDIVKPIKEEGYEIVFGSRFLEKKSKIPFFKKIFILPLASIINKIFFNIKLTDPQSGFRALSRKAALKIKIKNDRMAHCSEILHKSQKYKLKTKEIPITVFYHEYGQSFSGGLKIIKDLIISKFIN